MWGTGLFSDDTACDIRNYYRELLEDSVEDSAATRQTLERFEAYLQEPDGVALIAFAVTQSKVGRLEADVRDRALAIIDAGADLAVWEQENQRSIAGVKHEPPRSAQGSVHHGELDTSHRGGAVRVHAHRYRFAGLL